MKIHRKPLLVISWLISICCVMPPAPTLADDCTSGIDWTYLPVYDVLINPGTSIQGAIDANPEGTRFALAAGVHRLTAALAPKAGNQFLGFPGAILNGSRTLSGWQTSGSYWYVPNQTQRFPVKGECDPAFPLCDQDEDLFFNEQAFRQVDNLGQVVSGTFFFDYSASRIYIADAPGSNLIETTATERVFADAGWPGTPNVVVRNLIVEKFGTPGDEAAMSGVGQYWLIQDC
jgi:hypothetical protein